jgi:Hemerythrin HHE cation binding domain.
VGEPEGGTRAAVDVIDLLLAQHARIEQLFRDVLDAQGEQRRQRFEDLVRLLAVHETAEEEVVHPLARTRIDAGAEVVQARLAEERMTKELLLRLYESGTDAADFEDRFIALRDIVLLHAKREERYEFPHLRQTTDARTRERMADAVRLAEMVAPTRPHPGIESAAANILLGPGLAIVDRIRDAIRARLRQPA